MHSSAPGGRSRPARERSARDAARFPRPRWLNPLDARADSSASAPAKAALEAEGRHTADRNSKGPYRRRRAGSRTSDGTSTSTCTCPSSTAPTRSKTNRPVSTASGHQRTPNSNACSTPSPPASPAPWKGRGCCCAMTRAPFSTSSPPTISTHSSPPRLYAAINKPTASTTPAHHQASSRSERNRCVRPQPNSPSPRLRPCPDCAHGGATASLRLTTLPPRLASFLPCSRCCRTRIASARPHKFPRSHRQRTRQRSHQYSHSNADRPVVSPILVAPGPALRSGTSARARRAPLARGARACARLVRLRLGRVARWCCSCRNSTFQRERSPDEKGVVAAERPAPGTARDDLNRRGRSRPWLLRGRDELPFGRAVGGLSSGAVLGAVPSMRRLPRCIAWVGGALQVRPAPPPQ